MGNLYRHSILLSLLFVLAACSGSNEKVAKMNFKMLAKNGIAIGGYDAVAYFTQDNAVKGNKKYSAQWRDTTWLFSNSENQALFKQDPQKYIPQFAGHCALAVSFGKQENGDPDSWVVEDDKLYFNSNGFAKLLWKIIPGRNKAAHSKWSDEPV